MSKHTVTRQQAAEALKRVPDPSLAVVRDPVTDKFRPLTTYERRIGEKFLAHEPEILARQEAREAEAAAAYERDEAERIAQEQEREAKAARKAARRARYERQREAAQQHERALRVHAPAVAAIHRAATHTHEELYPYKVSYSIDESMPRTPMKEQTFDGIEEAIEHAAKGLGKLTWVHTRNLDEGLREEEYTWGPNRDGRFGSVWVVGPQIGTPAWMTAEEARQDRMLASVSKDAWSAAIAQMSPGERLLTAIFGNDAMQDAIERVQNRLGGEVIAED